MNSLHKGAGQRPRERLADRLHSSAIHLLRRLRLVDTETGLSGARLSALSVIVFRGPLRLGELASIEQVRPPTMSRMVGQLELDGLVHKEPDPEDGRAQLIHATDEGVRLMDRGRLRRIQELELGLGQLTDEQRSLLAKAVPLLERLAQPAPDIVADRAETTTSMPPTHITGAPRP